MTADLHIHTTASDGRLSPEDILKHAIEAGLSHIAITDHDTVDGLLDLYNGLKSGKENRIFLIPGIEFSTDLPDNEVHILGYHIDVHNIELHEQLGILTVHRRKRVKQMIYKLEQLGYPLDYSHVLEMAQQALSIGRPHIARALVEKGYVSTVAEAFLLLLDKNGPAYVPHYKLKPREVVRLIKKAGGIPVLAHPGLVKNDAVILDLIQHHGIMGLEVYHPAHASEEISKYLKMASYHQLFITGGSDFHGIPERFPPCLGMFTIPSILAEKLNNKENLKNNT